METEVFEELESEVRSYCRSWPTVFSAAQGSHVYDERGRDYLDFFAGAGALNYGHNHASMKEALLHYLQSDSIVHSLDMYTTAKRQFLEAWQQKIMSPRGLRYKVQFPGPAGSTAIEAALKLARKYTGRRTVITFTNAFHGMTLGALSVAGSSTSRTSAGVPIGDAVVMPYDQYPDGETAGLALLAHLLEDGGVDTPAAVIVEAVQGEGGMNTASAEWLQRLARICESHQVLLILDDVQMGCGRTGQFFSFEQAGIHPDMVCLSKSLSGYGLPFALTLFRPELDVWEPGEHTGTFRGPNLAFVTAIAAMDFWLGSEFETATLGKGRLVEHGVRAIAAEHDGVACGVRGRGMAWGIAFREAGLARRICANAFERGLLLETSGFGGEVVKLMPPLTTTDDELSEGLDILRDAVQSATGDVKAAQPGRALANAPAAG
jgi:diaminobutyrate--2-oxoglutarate aminotransferase